MEKQIIQIKDEYITLGQLLKLTNSFESGGFIKTYIKDVGVLVNNERDFRRGRKLYDADVITLEETNEQFIVKSTLN